MRKENPLFKRYSGVSKEMMCQMGYDLQSPIGLKDGVDDFEPIPYYKNSNIKNPRDNAAKMYGIGLPDRRGDKPVVVTIHRKQEPKKGNTLVIRSSVRWKVRTWWNQKKKKTKKSLESLLRTR